MATSLLALLDDIATLLDDVSILTKVTARKTASVLGDDLALNAQQVSGVRAQRELPVVWGVFLGSLRNKLILAPAALAISLIVPWLIMPLLMLGGLYLCFEGAEKVWHSLTHHAPKAEREQAAIEKALRDPDATPHELERRKIQGAVRTDFVLSAEIIVITLGIIASAPFLTQVLVLAGISVLMTVGVYGLVAIIVKIDDAGLYLSRRDGNGWLAGFARLIGRALVNAAPLLMKLLSILGTIAMFLVGGGIMVHGVALLESWVHHLADWVGQAVATALDETLGSDSAATLADLLHAVMPVLTHALIGLAIGALALALVAPLKRLYAHRHHLKV